MTAYCTSTCIKYKAKKPLEIGRYDNGQKRCNFCRIFMKCDCTTCHCCGHNLRSLPRSRKDKEKYYLQRI